MSEILIDPFYLDAKQFAADRHFGQTRKDAKETPYIEHPVEVASLLIQVGGVSDLDVVVAALLHDVLEDTPTKTHELKVRFGERVTRIVQEVSDDKRLPKIARKYLQVKGAPFISPEAKLVKLADKICNVRDILESPPIGWRSERKKEYFLWSKSVVDGLRGINHPLETAFDQLFQRQHELTD